MSKTNIIKSEENNIEPTIVYNSNYCNKTTL